MPVERPRDRLAHVRLLLVTDPRYGEVHAAEVILAAVRALPPGSFAVQLRDKVSPLARYQSSAAMLRAFTRAHHVPLILNGDPETARLVGADGLHVGAPRADGRPVTLREAREVLGEDAFLSVPAHDEVDVENAARDGADMVLVSPIRSGNAKQGRGVEAISAAAAILRRTPRRARLFALGGLTAADVAPCMAAGADGVAVVRALLETADTAAITAAVSAFAQALENTMPTLRTTPVP
jgi:thiamine-phosphate pyrophosphorylase